MGRARRETGIVRAGAFAGGLDAGGSRTADETGEATDVFGAGGFAAIEVSTARFFIVLSSIGLEFD
jgi:hypothetical protein